MVESEQELYAECRARAEKAYDVSEKASNDKEDRRVAGFEAIEYF